jgi:hypothetical protein
LLLRPFIWMSRTNFDHATEKWCAIAGQSQTAGLVMLHPWSSKES